jgi:large subunit ribosomal protein L4
MRLPVHDTSGQIVEHVEIDDRVFAVPLNEAVVHQAMVRQLANSRVGSADTKTRGQVSGSTRKLYRQKHTGRARRGSIRSPIARGGGITFGPHPRDYVQRMPKKMRRLALRCILSAKIASGELRVVNKLQLEQPKTHNMAQILKSIGVDGSVLIATSGPDATVIRSARNLRGARTLPADLLSVLDVLSHRFVVITLDGLRQVEKALLDNRCSTGVR